MSAAGPRWNLVRLDEVAPAPWRNGGGTTRELLALPNAQDWLWRLSVAEVTQDGRFSPFAGVQRWFAVLRGAGVRLHVDGQTHCLTVASPPLSFDGGALVDCTLIDGPTRDFNLMARSGTAVMERVKGSWSRPVRAMNFIAAYTNGARATVYSGSETIDLPPHTLAWRILDADGTVQLVAQDALWMEITNHER